MNEMKFSVVIPAYNEAENLGKTAQEAIEALEAEKIPYEMIIVNDNSTDETPNIIKKLQEKYPAVKNFDRQPPGGVGRAIREGLELVEGDAVVVCMADSSDSPKDLVAYYRKLEEGYDCVYGSRFIKGSNTTNYPPLKLVVNRIVNTMIRWMFRCPFNDLTNAFKAYRTEVIRECSPYRACHFNITIEMSLSALIRKYNIAQIPISWQGRTWGESNLSLRRMGRRYLEILLKAFLEKLLIQDDLMADRLARKRNEEKTMNEIFKRLDAIENKIGTERPKARDSVS